MKKALILQSLFFCVLLSAQDIYFKSPKASDPLEDVQEFVIGVGPVAPTRMEFYLNGRLKLARRNAPFQFKIRWNTSMENRVKVIAYFGQGEPVVLEKTFSEIKTDFKQEVQAFHCFPFLEKPLPAKWSFRSQGQVMEPQNFNSANRFPLSLVIALDISGSMKFDLPELSDSFHDFLNHAREKGYEIEFLLFDSQPRSLNPQQTPKQLEELYNGEPKSVIWDSLATGTGFFKDTPRRVVLLISDGNDDGSVHNLNSAGLYFKEPLHLPESATRPAR